MQSIRGLLREKKYEFIFHFSSPFPVTRNLSFTFTNYKTGIRGDKNVEIPYSRVECFVEKFVRINWTYPTTCRPDFVGNTRITVYTKILYIRRVKKRFLPCTH